MATAPSEINMGYGGFCGVDWKTDSLIQKPFTDVATTPSSITPHQIFITGGNIGVSYNRPTENTYKAPRDTTAASPLLFGNGTAQISGQISFDMAHFNIDYFLDQAKLSRNTYFHLLMSDGGNTYGVYYNMWNSFSINASAESIVNCNLGYMSLNCFSPQINTVSSISTGALTNIFNKALVAYWEAGTQGYVQSFTINITQDVTPVYLNNSLIMPSYLRSGSLKINANIYSCIGWQNITSLLNLSTSDTNQQGNQQGTNGDFSFKIGNKTFTLKNALLSSQQYNHSGAGDVVKYSYAMQSVALKSPSQALFTITGGDLTVL